MPNVTTKMVDVKEPIDIWGWVMFTEPFYTDKGLKFGEHVKIKTVASYMHNNECIPIYLDVVIRLGDLTEALHPFNRPIPIKVKGVKRYQKVYPNLYPDGVEQTSHIMWIGLYLRHLSLSIANVVPDAAITAHGTAVPVKTMKDYFTEKALAKRHAQRAVT